MIKTFVAASAIGLMAAMPSAAQDWTGGWTGVSLGVGAGTYQQGVSEFGEVGVDVDVEGLMIGVQYGRNYQRGNTVFGFDLALTSGIDGITAQGTQGPFWSCNSGDCNVSIDALFTLRGRFGVLINPQTLAYGAGGFAVGQVVGGILNSPQQGTTNTATGYTLGLGVERMIAENITMFGEANYVDLGTLDFGTGSGATFDGEGDFATIKMGLNFRF